jgi:hypothetical protein
VTAKSSAAFVQAKVGAEAGAAAEAAVSEAGPLENHQTLLVPLYTRVMKGVLHNKASNWWIYISE